MRISEVALCIAAIAAVAALPWAHATDLSIEVGQNTYYFGDRLSFTVTVSEVTGEPAFMYIIDEDGKRSSSIQLHIGEAVTEEISPFPFEKATYPEGRWMLEIHYAGTTAETTFLLADSGRAVIPAWIKDVGRLWVNGAINEQQFMTSIESLAYDGVISTDGAPESEGTAFVPAWFKFPTILWIQEEIPDHTYAAAIEYLILQGVAWL